MPQSQVLLLLFCLPICNATPKVKNLVLHFPFKKNYRSMYTVDLIEFIFTEMIDGVNFLPIAESLAAVYLSRYVPAT